MTILEGISRNDRLRAARRHWYLEQLYNKGYLGLLYVAGQTSVMSYDAAVIGVNSPMPQEVHENEEQE